MLLWFADSTKVATIQQPRPKRSFPLQDPRKRLWTFFFFWISHSQLCELWRPGGNFQRCLLERASQRWNPELRSRSYNRDTGAVHVQRAVRFPHVEREVQRRKNKLGTEALRTFAWINCAERSWFFLECAYAERERERERVGGTYRWRKFRFQWLSQRSEEGQESQRDSKCRWELGAAERTVAYRPVSSVLTSTGFSMPSIFSQSAERPHEQRRMASKKEQLLALYFITWITPFSCGKFFMGFRRAKSTQGNTNCQ